MTRDASARESGQALSIVVPARNEAHCAPDVLLSLRRQFPLAQLILVDNGSTDGTATLALQVPGVQVVTESCPGKGHAMRTGAQAATGEFILFHDADREYDVRDAQDVVESARSLGGCVIGVRMVSFDSVRWSSWLANRTIQILLRLRFGKSIPDVLSGTRCMRRQDFMRLGTHASGFGIETEIAVASAKRGICLHSVGVRYRPRNALDGKKIRAWHLFALVRIALG